MSPPPIPLSVATAMERNRKKPHTAPRIAANTREEREIFIPQKYFAGMLNKHQQQKEKSAAFLIR